MDLDPAPDQLSIVGLETADHTVSVDVLVRALDGLQRIVYLMAASSQNQPIGDRFTPTDDLRERHALRCGLPHASSFAVPIVSKPSDSTLFPAPSPLSETWNLFRLARAGRWDELNSIFSGPEYRNRVLSELRRMLPRSGERWGLGLRVDGEFVTLDDSASRSLGSHLSSSATEDATMTVTGELLRVNIESRRLVIRYRPTRTEIPCQCEPSVFRAVMSHYDVPIQVTGRYTLDRKGHPLRLTGVSRVEPIDLSPLSFARATSAGRTLAIDPPLRLSPTMDEESGQFFIVRDRDLGIDVFARTRDDLMDELAEQILFQWDAYARESPDRLSRGARRLRDALLGRLREVDHAPLPEKGGILAPGQGVREDRG